MKTSLALLISYLVAAVALLLPLIAAFRALIDPRFERYHWILGSYICGMTFVVARTFAALLPHSSQKDEHGS